METAVGIITCKRQKGLGVLLAGLAELRFEGEVPEIRIVVVDNDSDESARPVCEDLPSDYPWSVEYHTESQRGISYARNTAITKGLRSADFFAFIDDDEIPETDWLYELIRVCEVHEADVVAGPVVPRFTEAIPDWVRKGHFFDRRRRATGTRLDRAFTGNILFRRHVLEETRPHFDPRLALTGGSDSLFSQRLHRAGYKLIWADEAMVHETVPTSRITPGWLYQRSFRTGATATFVQRDFYGVFRAIAFTAASGGFWMAKGSMLLLCTGWMSKHNRVQAIRLMYYSAGVFSSWFGKGKPVYQKIHGE